MEAGVVGDIVAHQFDDEGRVLDISANKRAINLTRIPSGRSQGDRRVGQREQAGPLPRPCAEACSCLVTDARAAEAV